MCQHHLTPHSAPPVPPTYDTKNHLPARADKGPTHLLPLPIAGRLVFTQCALPYQVPLPNPEHGSLRAGSDAPRPPGLDPDLPGHAPLPVINRPSSLSPPTPISQGGPSGGFLAEV